MKEVNGDALQAESLIGQPPHLGVQQVRLGLVMLTK